MAKQTKKTGHQLAFQLLINFILPIIVLTRFSADNMLGPTKSLLLALSFPILYEFYNVLKNKKISWISIISIGGILLTGSLSLLELSIGWLAIRRSAPYIFIAVGILISEKFYASPSQKIAEQILNIKKINQKIKDKSLLKKLYKKCSYLAATLFSLIAVTSYFLTRTIITSPTNTTLFNQQYASLRIWSIAAITVPILIGCVAILWYLISKIEKLTGLDSDQFLKT